ncbi:hypothetical protein J2X66_000126 [Pseudomonas sp. 3296]|nr:hypothetical protein [Pseudomonas sp. 3296]
MHVLGELSLVRGPGATSWSDESPIPHPDTAPIRDPGFHRGGLCIALYLTAVPIHSTSFPAIAEHSPDTKLR